MTAPIIFPRHHTLQNVNAPDIEAERDLLEPEAEIAFGMQAAMMAKSKKFRVNIATIVISALIFLMILAWFDFIQTTFFAWLSPETENGLTPPSVKLWYAILSTIIIIIIVTLIYYYYS